MRPHGSGIGLGRDWPLTNMDCHMQEMQQRLSVPQQQAVAAGFDEFVTSVRSAASGSTCHHTYLAGFSFAPKKPGCVDEAMQYDGVRSAQVVESLKRKAQTRQGDAENVISAQDIREAVDSFKKSKSLG